MVSIIYNNDCVPSIAGIKRLFVLPCHELHLITFGSKGEITNVLTNGLGDGWIKIDIQENTSFLKVTKKFVKKDTYVYQMSIEFYESGINQDVLFALSLLTQSCCLYAIVEDNLGRFIFCGLDISADYSTYWSANLRTGDGLIDTGKSIETDIAITQDSLVCTTNTHPPFVTTSVNNSGFVWDSGNGLWDSGNGLWGS